LDGIRIPKTFEQRDGEEFGIGGGTSATKTPFTPGEKAESKKMSNGGFLALTRTSSKGMKTKGER